ncbi:MAG: hypothetical protein QOG53_3099 [Frankiales bacterium]|jgi:hypothetical protein|nr:hypothetical protein [Frankiales bacterium]
MSESTMVEVKVLVPGERVPDFYEMFGRWLAGTADEAPSSTKPVQWSNTEDDLALAKAVWEKLSDRARALFSKLMDAPADQKFNGEQLAHELHIPNGKYGVAGVLAWPKRHSAAVGRWLPVTYKDGPVGEPARYWMEADVAAVFRKARESKSSGN